MQGWTELWAASPRVRLERRRGAGARELDARAWARVWLRLDASFSKNVHGVDSCMSPWGLGTFEQSVMIG